MPRILVAEDNTTLRESLRDLLEIKGHEVTTVCDGAAALDLLAEGKDFDLIISDNDMPRMNGLDLLKSTKGHPRTMHIPFLLYSGRDDDRLRDAVLGAGGIFHSKHSTDRITTIVNDALASKSAA